ncbi:MULTISPECIES: hybrid sensor histidine kinase/response regulator [Pseudomonas]|jgi:PAS domain S-box-containing protein|uniref:histidine kinase n=2 Tax=Pseudomonas TaxID=286 RepID=A0A1L7NAT9_PSEPU|nr:MULTISPECIES: hybrid sensor histidine kinase/response regulator [Pseudomonas]MBH3451140.1 response regulator [Pseudomonas putida]MBP2084096.1 PAS domain S-box-containing protein [Pseudomonas sp. PvP089]MBP2090202.1 PAS domain S-box-containing protein [Pseudomonas sp. PvP088]MBP2223634.1 PAS domain S-box-containing protein [Pseudomonas putida]MCE0965880.1 response regulator [Pseudomonas sp. NMI4491_12]
MQQTPLKLLMVEDSSMDAELTLMRLERSGLHVQSQLVFDHVGVEHALREARYDLILCDCVLPGSSGTEVLAISQRLAPDTPFIFLSGIYGEEHAVEMIRLGATDYVLKKNLPLLPKAVRRALTEVQERQRRRRAEEALVDVEARARIAIDAAGMGTWDLRPQEHLLLWDDRCKILFGLPVSTEMSLEVFYDGIYPDDLPMVREAVEHAMRPESGGRYRVEFRIAQPNGLEPRWLLSSGQSQFVDGQCVRFSGVLQDVNTQRLATQALRQLNEMLGERVERRTRERDRAWELSQDLLAVLNKDLTPVALNPAWEASLGFSRERLSQTSLLHLLPEPDQELLLTELAALAHGRTSVRFVGRILHAGGQQRWLSWVVVPEDTLLYVVARDITSEREAALGLAEANARLREQINERERIEAALQQMQRLEAVGQLTAGVAHDFNNLLTVILTGASFLERDLAKADLDKARTRLTHIREAGERGAKLTSQLLAFSRRQRLEPVALNLNQTLTGLEELLRRTLGGNVSVRLDLDQALWQALTDPTQTEMIILNLAINARDAMPDGGQLTLTTRNTRIDTRPQRPEDPDPGEYVMLSIRDTGCGMNEEVLTKVFEPFFTTKDIGKGSGLGLAQVFGFAKQSGGGVHIDTAPGQGTQVAVYLPAVKDQAVSEPVVPMLNQPVSESGRNRTVLLVDDDHLVRDMLGDVLRQYGYQVRQAHSGEQALALLDDEIDLLLTDFAMPEFNGAQLALAAREGYPQLPVVFLTGYAELQGLELPGSVVIQKPVQSDQLARVLNEMLGITG